MPIQILMPALSPTMTEGAIVRWLKAEGDQIKSGDLLAEIETDKATMELEAFDEGRIAKLAASEGSNVSVGDLIVFLGSSFGNSQLVRLLTEVTAEGEYLQDLACAPSR